MKRILPIIVVFLLAGSACFAGRPLKTEDTGTLSPEEWEIEGGYTYFESKDNEVENSIAVKISKGLIEGVHFGIEVPYLSLHLPDVDDSTGIGDASVSLKWAFLGEDGNIPSMALNLAVKLANGDKDEFLGSGETDNSIMLVFGKTTGLNEFSMNVGYSDIGGTDDYEVSYGLSVKYNYIEGASLVAEIYGSTAYGEESSEGVLNSTFGANWDLYDWLAADFGVTQGLSENSPRMELTAGLTATL